MEILKNKIDFTLIFEVKSANPNGDPMFGNRPRTNFEELGEVSDVCLKRKIRNRLMQAGESIFVVSQDDSQDFASLKDRYISLAEEKGIKSTKQGAKDQQKIRDLICEKWIDVRAFGQVFAFKSPDVSLGVRGAMSIQSAYSLDKVEVNSMQITKSVNSESGDKKGSDTMGMKHRIEYAVYRTNGSINVHFAEKNGFSTDDAEKIKEAIKTIFDNDISSARPEGSMRVVGFVWWTHDTQYGNMPSYDLFDTVKITKNEGVTMPHKLEDYTIEFADQNALNGIKQEIIINKF